MSSRLTTASGIGLITYKESPSYLGFLLKKLTKDLQTAGDIGARNILVTQVHNPRGSWEFRKGYFFEKYGLPAKQRLGFQTKQLGTFV